jgi:hypothetical protein
LRQSGAAVRSASLTVLRRERFVNLPPQIAVGLFQALHADLNAAVKEVLIGRVTGVLLRRSSLSAVKGSMPAPKTVVMVVKGWKAKGEADPEQQVRLLCLKVGFGVPHLVDSCVRVVVSCVRGREEGLACRWS